MLVVTLPFLGEESIRGQHDVVFLQLGVGNFLSVEKEDAQAMSQLDLRLNLALPLLDKCDRANDQIGLPSS
jgi:hypothetical protein